MRSKTRTIRRITAQHNMTYKTIPLKSAGEIRYLNGFKKL